MKLFNVVVSGDATIQVQAESQEEAMDKIEEVLADTDKGLELIENELDAEEVMIIKGLSNYSIDWANEDERVLNRVDTVKGGQVIETKFF